MEFKGCSGGKGLASSPQAERSGSKALQSVYFRVQSQALGQAGSQEEEEGHDEQQLLWELTPGLSSSRMGEAGLQRDNPKLLTEGISIQREPAFVGYPSCASHKA